MGEELGVLLLAHRPSDTRRLTRISRPWAQLAAALAALALPARAWILPPCVLTDSDRQTGITPSECSVYVSWHLGVIGSLVHAALSAKARVLKGAVRAEQVAQRPYPCLEHVLNTLR